MFKNLIVYCHRVIRRIPEWSFQPTMVTTVRLSSGLCVCLTVCNVGVFARIYGPYLRPVYTGAFLTPVHTINFNGLRLFLSQSYACSDINCAEMFKNLIVYSCRFKHRFREWSLQPTVVNTVHLILLVACLPSVL